MFLNWPEPAGANIRSSENNIRLRTTLAPHRHAVQLNDHPPSCPFLSTSFLPYIHPTLYPLQKRQTHRCDQMHGLALQQQQHQPLNIRRSLVHVLMRTPATVGGA